MFLNYLIIFFISMVPIVELRGAIPVAVGMGMEGWQLFWAYVICVIGNMLPVPLIYFFARKVLAACSADLLLCQKGSYLG